MTCSCVDTPSGGRHGPWRRLGAACALTLLLLVAGCANVPVVKAGRALSRTLVAPPDAPLATVTADIGLPDDRSAVWPLVQASFALDARLTMIRNARVSIDVQSYLVGDDSIGRSVLRALRDAALRGVRVRLLVDDLYTVDLDRLLLGLAATPNAEVRLFNPVITARSSSLRRLIALVVDFRRLNHRMHNKLFIVDGRMAVAGGRNLADEYFLRGAQGNFIDFDLMLAGAVVKSLGSWFDLYWNSEQVFPVEEIVRASGIEVAGSDALQTHFDQVTHDLPGAWPPVDPVAVDIFGALPFSRALAERRFRFLAVDAVSFADAPSKIDTSRRNVHQAETLTHRFLESIGEAKSEALLMSPYFIPGDEAMSRIRQLRAARVHVAVITNSLAVSDEPLVNIQLGRHQTELLQMGVELYELSSNRLKMDRSLRGLLGSSTGRLHAKLAIVDRRGVSVGSMNLDPRSSNINTEVGIRVESPDLVRMIIEAYKVDSLFGLYQVRLRADGRGVEWTAVNDGGTEELQSPPDTSAWQRLHLLLLSWFVPENEL